MEIITALKTEDIRITCGRTWLFWNNQSEEWVVYERRIYAKKNNCLYTGQSLEAAIDILVGD